MSEIRVKIVPRGHLTRFQEIFAEIMDDEELTDDEAVWFGAAYLNLLMNKTRPVTDD